MGLCRNKGVPVTFFSKPTQPATSCPTGAGYLRHCCSMSPFNPDKHPHTLLQITRQRKPWETSLGLSDGGLLCPLLTRITSFRTQPGQRTTADSASGPLNTHYRVPSSLSHLWWHPVPHTSSAATPDPFLPPLPSLLWKIPSQATQPRDRLEVCPPCILDALTSLS